MTHPMSPLLVTRGRWLNWERKIGADAAITEPPEGKPGYRCVGGMANGAAERRTLLPLRLLLFPLFYLPNALGFGGFWHCVIGSELRDLPVGL